MAKKNKTSVVNLGAAAGSGAAITLMPFKAAGPSGIIGAAEGSKMLIKITKKKGK